MADVLSKFLYHGAWGGAVIMLGLVIKSLYKRNQQLSAERESLHGEYQRKLDLLTERYVAKAEGWAEKNRDVAQNTNLLLEAILQSKRKG